MRSKPKKIRRPKEDGRDYPRADQLNAPIMEGRIYRVPTIEGRWGGTNPDNGDWGDWPVLGERHADPDLAEPIPHYHLDLRFIPEARIKGTRNFTIFGHIECRPLRYELWTCENYAVLMSGLTSPNGMAGFAERWIGKQCPGSKEAGWMCPHQHTWLGGQLIVKGVITCPSHGLIIDPESGKIVGFSGESKKRRP
jgi:hypothetical protein